MLVFFWFTVYVNVRVVGSVEIEQPCHSPLPVFQGTESSYVSTLFASDMNSLCDNSFQGLHHNIPVNFYLRPFCSQQNVQTCLPRCKLLSERTLSTATAPLVPIPLLSPNYV